MNTHTHTGAYVLVRVLTWLANVVLLFRQVYRYTTDVLFNLDVHSEDDTNVFADHTTFL